MRTIPAMLACLSLPFAVHAGVTSQQLESAIAQVDDAVLAWRRDFHRHPELSNREFRTSKVIADHLKMLGLTVRTGVAHTGVTAVLEGGKPGPTIALRADMDALPVTEQTAVAFKSTATAEFLGKKVGVMHACGHDAHMAVLMGVAQALTSLREELPGTVLFLFQPAEEGPPQGEDGGAALMLEEGVFEDPRPEAVFGMHVFSQLPSGVIAYRSGPFMAASDTFRIEVTGRQSHGSRPWSAVDPIVAASQIVLGLQTIVSRQIDITKLPAVVTIGKFDAGVRQNIIPDTAELLGTLRTFDPLMREDIIERMRKTAENIAAASGAKATLRLSERPYPAVVNDPTLTARMLPTLRRVVGEEHLLAVPLQTGGEDFSLFAQQVPGFFFFVGVTPRSADVASAPSNHSPLFYIDEPALAVATRAMVALATDYLQGTR